MRQGVAGSAPAGDENVRVLTNCSQCRTETVVMSSSSSCSTGWCCKAVLAVPGWRFTKLGTQFGAGQNSRCTGPHKWTSRCRAFEQQRRIGAEAYKRILSRELADREGHVKSFVWLLQPTLAMIEVLQNAQAAFPSTISPAKHSRSRMTGCLGEGRPHRLKPPRSRSCSDCDEPLMPYPSHSPAASSSRTAPASSTP